jgi:ABC-type sugar transport system substrate-binding protein
MNDRRYAMNVAVSDLAFWHEPRHTWEKIGSIVPGVATLFGGPVDPDVSKQIQELEMLISQDVSGLVIFSNDSEAVAPAIDKAVEKEIPVVTAFADVPGSKRLAHIGSHQVAMARQIADQVINDYGLKPEPKVSLRPKALISIGAVSSRDQMERRDGFASAIERYMHPVVDWIEDGFSPTEAERKISELLANEDIKFIFGCNSQSAIGAVEALKKQGKHGPGDVIVTGWDTEAKVMQEIAAERSGDGWIHATAALYASYMVHLCFGLLEAANFGYLYPDTLNTEELRLPAVPREILIPMKVVTCKNVDEYLGKQPDFLGL